MKRVSLFAIIAAVLLGGGAYFYLSGSSGSGAPEVAQAQTPADDHASHEHTGSTGSAGQTVSVDELMAPGEVPDMILGDANAPVTVVEYASLSCSHCRDFHVDTLPEVKKRLVETGKVRFVFRDFPLDQYATAGAMLARCNGDDKYFAVIEAFFAQQSSLLSAQDPFAWLQSFAKQVGYTQESLEACLSNQELMDNLLAVRERASQKFGVSSTPTFFFNGKVRRGGMSVEEFEKEVELAAK